MKKSLQILPAIIYFTLVASFIYSCSPKQKEEPRATQNDKQEGYSEKENSDDEEGTENQNEENSGDSGCKFDDGTHSATVDYYNSETGHSATYTLDVEVQDCQVVQINFPSGGYLDEDHITAAELDADGHATVEGEDGKTYEVQID